MIKGILKKATILTLLLSLCGIAFAEVVDTAGVEANSTVVETIISGPVLDDFNDGGKLNNWGYNTGAFYTTGASCADSRDATSPQEGAFCLKLDYNVSTSGSYAGYWSKLGGEDLSGYTSISFWVKATAGGELLKVELKNSSTVIHRSTAAVYVTDFLDGGVTTSWTEVTIPFHNFVNLDGWNNMKELVFTFENSQAVMNGSPTQGTIYIDRISFSSSSVNEVRIDYYGDKIGTCALGGNLGDWEKVGNAGDYTHLFTDILGDYLSPPYALESIYNATLTNPYGGQYVIFGGGTDGWTEIPHDFSAYNYVSVCVKAKSASENPKVLKIEIADRSSPPYPYVILGAPGAYITTTWQRFIIPLNNLVVNQGLNKKAIRKIVFTYERSRIINDAGGSKQGVLYIDNIRFDVDTQ